MRNRMIHGYFDIDLQVVWEVTQNDLPVLKAQVAQGLGEIRESDE
jgi:uncharacterized protein with HEPN domain